MIGIVLNPAAGRGRGAKIRSAIEEELAKHPQEWRILATSGPGDGARCTQELIAAGAARIGVAGGDGTLSECLPVMQDSSIPLGVIPLGTGNDFGRHIGVRTWRQGLETLIAGSPERIDIGLVNGRPFLDTVACGFDSAVGQRVNEGSHFLKGTAAYLAAVIATLASYRCSEMTIRVDGEAWSGRAMLCAVCNCRSYGGGLNVAPHASITDGLLDVVVVQEMSKLRFLMQFPKVFRGSHLDLPEVRHWQGTQIQIESNPPIRYLRDGELEGFTPGEIEILPARQLMMLPAKEL